MMKLVFLLAIMLFSVRSYEVEEEVLVLHDSDFPNILQEFNYILIEFYAPWCGHCQRLQPAYTEAAKALAEKGSPIKLAKVDATQEPTSASDYGVSGYPTIFFFLNGAKIDFTGDRTKDAIISWIEKKILPATSDIHTQEALDKLSEDGVVHVVLFSEHEKERSDFGAHAAADEYNKYYTAAGELLKKYKDSTVEIIRNFGKVMTLKGLTDKFSNWVNKHSRPLVLEFDDRTIKDIFQKQKDAIVLFNQHGSEALSKLINDVSNDYDGSLIFVEITPENEHYHRFAEFIKLDVQHPRLIALMSSEQKKAVYSKPVSELTVEGLKDFISQLEKGSVELIGLQGDEGDSEDGHQHQHQHDHQHQHQHDHQHQHGDVEGEDL